MAYTKDAGGGSRAKGGASGKRPYAKRGGAGNTAYTHKGKPERKFGEGGAYGQTADKSAPREGFNRGGPQKREYEDRGFNRGDAPMRDYQGKGFNRGGPQKREYEDRQDRGFNRGDVPMRDYQGKGFNRGGPQKREYEDRQGFNRGDVPMRDYQGKGFSRGGPQKREFEDRQGFNRGDAPTRDYQGKGFSRGGPQKREYEDRQGFNRGDAQKRDYQGKGFSRGGPQKREFEDRQDRDINRGAPLEQATPVIEQQEQTLPYFLMGRNAVREAVKNDRSIDRILVVPEQDGSLREIISLAREKGVVIRVTDRKKLDEMCMPFGHNNKPGNHQGILALVPDIEYVGIQDILDLARQREQAPFVLLLDEINDPHNLGSMLRSAACAGVHGIVIKKRRSASVTAAVAKISAGAVEHVKVAKVANLTSAMDTLKKAGVWIAGADQRGTPMAKADLSGPLAIVIGNESEGISRLVKERCDLLVGVPMRGNMDSLNASVAAAVLMFEKIRQEG